MQQLLCGQIKKSTYLKFKSCMRLDRYLVDEFIELFIIKINEDSGSNFR